MFSNGFATGALAALLATAQLATAHMEIQEPAPFRSKFNPNANNVDYTNTAPLDPSGANYPCKGYHVDVGTASGKPTASYAPGGTYQFKVVGGAPHGGGSCQVSLSYDKGASFTVIESIIGGCPLSSSYPFTIPEDAPEGEAIWAWTWSNKVGNREHYMNCAPVTISKSAKREEKQEIKRAAVPFSQRPPVFKANLGNGCSVAEGTDVVYPNPGPDVLNNGGNQQPPTGNCGASGSSPAPNPSSGNGGSAPSTTAQASVTTKPVSLPGGVFITVPAGGAQSSAAPVASSAAAPVVSAAPAVSSVAPAPTTLVVSTRPASAAPAPAPTGGAGSGSGAGGHAVGAACSNEGAWNCIGGNSFQRCASGTWSATIQMAPGTTCTAGESDALVTAHARRSFRWRQGSKIQLA